MYSGRIIGKQNIGHAGIGIDHHWRDAASLKGIHEDVADVAIVVYSCGHAENTRKLFY
jgi:hypothetical protein